MGADAKLDGAVDDVRATWRHWVLREAAEGLRPVPLAQDCLELAHMVIHPRGYVEHRELLGLKYL